MEQREGSASPSTPPTESSQEWGMWRGDGGGDGGGSRKYRERLQAIPTLDKTCSWCGVDHQGAFSTTFIFKQEHRLAKRRKIPFLCPGTCSSPGGGEALGTGVQQLGAGDISLSSVFGEIQTITLNSHTCCGQHSTGISSVTHHEGEQRYNFSCFPELYKPCVKLTSGFDEV